MKKIKLILFCSLLVMGLVGCEQQQTQVKEKENIEAVVQEESKQEQIIEEIIEEPEEVIINETGIRIDTNDVKKEYKLNEEIDLSNLKIYVIFDNDTEELLASDMYSISEVNTNEYGEKLVTVTYKEYVQEFSIKVIYVINDVEEKIKYASTSLNLRNGPGTNFEKLTSISLNTEVKVTGEVENGWSRIIYKDQEYFCSSKYLMNEKKEIQVQPASPYDNKVYGEPGSSASIVNSANSYWNSTVPNWLKQKYIDSGWNIAISGTSLAARYGYGMSIAGITDYGARIIYIDNRQSPIKRSMIHELGHFIDYVYGFPSQSGEFAEIFNAEKYSFVDCTAVGDGHETSNVMEYFASVFQNAIINGANCQRQAPRSYEFVCRYMR